MIVLETENLILKKYQKEDFRHFCDIHLSPTVMKYFNGGAMNIKEAKERFDGVLAHQIKFGFSYYAVFHKITNEYVGQCGLYYNFDMSLNLCYALLDKFHNRGYGTEMITAVLKQGFEDLKFSIISVLIAVENQPSIHVVEKLGGKRGKEKILQNNLRAVDYTILKEDFYNSLKNLKHYKYRKAIGSMLINNQGLIYCFNRTDFPSWQCVEGGIDGNETPLEASYRETEEEIGIKKNQLEYISETKHFFKYNLGLDYYNKYSYIGQEKKFFLYRFLGKETDFNYKSTNQKEEFSCFKLMKSKELIKSTPYFKKEMYEYVLSEFKQWVK